MKLMLEVNPRGNGHSPGTGAPGNSRRSAGTEARNYAHNLRQQQPKTAPTQGQEGPTATVSTPQARGADKVDAGGRVQPLVRPAHDDDSDGEDPPGPRATQSGEGICNGHTWQTAGRGGKVNRPGKHRNKMHGNAQSNKIRGAPPPKRDFFSLKDSQGNR